MMTVARHDSAVRVFTRCFGSTGNPHTGNIMTSHYLPHDQWTALVDALIEARGDHDPRNAAIIALAEVGFIVPDTCREDSASLQEAA